MGTQKITMGRRGDTEYESKKAAAMGQADPKNAFMWGVQTTYEGGKASRSPKYGNPQLVNNTDTQHMQPDSAGNQITTDPMNQTGFLDGQVSSTLNPQADPQIMGEQAAERIKMIAAGHQHPGFNNRQQIYRA